MARTGNGTTASFSASSFSPAYLSIGGTEFTREPLSDTALSNSSFMSYTFDDLVEPGQIEFRYFWDETNVDEPLTLTGATVQTLTVTYGTSETLSGTGNFISVTHPEHQNGVLREGSAVWKWDGKTGPVYSGTT